MRIVVGITGGIAAYKAVNVVRAFVLAGHDVQVIATEAALRFVGRPTLEAISRNPVHSELYEGVAEVRHVALGQHADLIVIAPATANTLAKLAQGLADDLLGNTVLASTAPLVVAPAMHTEMWQHPATVANVATLRERGVTVIGPAAGQLTGTDSGPGRMSEPDDIVHAALAALGPRDLVGQHVLVTAGGTREPLDPVRFLGNRSSGKQGVAIARAAAARGAEVTLIAAHTDPGVLEGAVGGVEVVRVETARELGEAAHRAAESASVVVMAAAVADYRPEAVSELKIKKETQGETRRPGQLIIGFAAETETDRDALIELGRRKAERKGTDFLVVNAVGWSEGFSQDDNAILVLDSTGSIVEEASGSKASVAHRILDLTR